ncbi:MAG: hypothetical protein PHD61_10470 [Bacteroidales bacterium]|nr:hypothetical protein [Lentimicrobiaceae bacterium]MDD5695710.1 hypothetical protein [Bacteroidales bacterium]
MIKLLLITIVLIAFAFMSIGIKMLFKKGGRFEKRCSSVDPKTGENLACTCGSGEGGADCRNNLQSTDP